MSRDTIFTAGSLARAYFEIADWYGKHAEDIGAKKICVPFSGFGRMASAMCQDDTTVHTCDYQRLHTCIVDGVFCADNLCTNVDKPRFHKGLAVAGKCVKGMDMHSAGFVDWVVNYGTPLDVAAVAMSLPGQTFRGHLGNWTGSFDRLYDKYLKTRDEFREFIAMPGTWQCYEADLFRLLGTGTLNAHYDVVAIDPPRLSPGPTGRDSYSTGVWPRLNVALGGSVKIKPWTFNNFFTLLHRVLREIDSDYILFSWTDSSPPLTDVRDSVLYYGELEDQERWEAFNKTFYSWRIKRRR